MGGIAAAPDRKVDRMPVFSKISGLFNGGIGPAWQKLKTNGFMRGLAILTSASLLQNLISFGTMPIISRLFAPDDYGIAGLIMILGILPALWTTGQYHLALGVVRNRVEAVNIVALSVVMTLINAVIFFFILQFFAHHPAFMPESFRNAAPYLWTIPLFMVVNAATGIARIWEIRNANYTSQVVNRVTESSGIAVSQIAFGFLGLGPIGLIAGRVFGFLCAAIHGFGRIMKQIGREGLRQVSRVRMTVLARRHWRFPVYQFSGDAMGEIARQLTPLLLAVYYPVEVVGLYWFATRLLERPAIVWGANVGRVFYQHAADKKKARQPIFRLYFRSTMMLVATAIIPFGIVIAFGPSIFGVLFGEQWTEAGEYARWISIVNFCFLIIFPARGASTIYGLQHIFAKMSAIRAVVAGTIIVAIASQGGDELTTIAAAAVGEAIAMIALLVIVGLRLKHMDQALPKTAP